MNTTESAPAQTGATTRSVSVHDLLTRKDLRLNRDASRVVTKLFVLTSRPAEEAEGAAYVVRQIQNLDAAELDAAYARVCEAFSSRHRDLDGVFARNYEAMRHRVAAGVELDRERQLLVGALFTQEIAIEGAALTNPSMVPHPDQSGLAEGELRFVMSARAVGEGHVSAVEFRTGVVTRDGEIEVDKCSPYADIGTLRETTYDRAALAVALDRPEGDEVSAYLLRRLPERFDEQDVQRLLRELPPPLRVLERMDPSIAAEVHQFLVDQYRQTFDAAGDLSERVLWPLSPADQAGLEDARFVRFTDLDGTVDYRATYTANRGHSPHTRTQLIRTPDFRTFEVTRLFGGAVGEKDMALFPRPVHGRYLAMSRWDRRHNAIAVSEDGVTWPDADASVLDVPPRIWRLLKGGNCGSPIETPAGWLVLTHGVGPMRAYSIGALLLDLDDPTRVLGVLEEPLVAVTPDERDGYVPNVVYTCGALPCGDTLVLPFGFGDMGIEFATASLPELLAAMSGRGR
ncbi:MAG: glycosidase [Catenulispora sp.]|nr:glycosidase [Catenulispora sp.]